MQLTHATLSTHLVHRTIGRLMAGQDILGRLRTYMDMANDSRRIMVGNDGSDTGMVVL